MNINVANAAAVQPLPFNERHDFRMVGHGDARQLFQKLDGGFAGLQSAAGQLPEHKRMHQDFAAIQQRGETGVPLTEVSNPHGGVDENHTPAADRLRGAGARRGWLPPSFARRRELLFRLGL